MKWGRPKGASAVDAQYAIVSSCGQYAIAKIGFSGGCFYEARRTRLHPEGPHLVSTNIKTPDDARALCEADAND